jgi:hypothetical protein
MPNTLKGLLATSLLLAVANLLLPFVAGMAVIVPSAGLWLSLLILTVMEYGKRGLWLLIGSPVALFWAIVLVLYSFHYIDLP